MSYPTSKICFNSECRVPNSERWRKGWRLRNYDFANLCDLCGSIYEEGRFCETFHKYASGWRSCETCGKRVHCGCIVSVHDFEVLDSGGIECTLCSRKNAILMSNPIWPPRPFTGWLTEGPIRSWNQAAGPGSSGPWPQVVNLYDKSVAYADLKSRTSVEADVSTGFERLFGNDRSATFLSERHGTQSFSFSNESLRHNGSEVLKSGNTGGQADNQRRVSGSLPQQLCHIVGKKHSGNSDERVDSSHQSEVHNDKQADARAWKELLPQYWPKMSDEVQQHISEGSNSVITPLFEKTLSASDTGRIGRLVLPKKCAEIYFPAISQPEGLPLKVQDVKGKEWIFQFRFWPNNNSRMYVLEGITNCLQSLQLQAGDVVTFSRIEPAGKLVMGFKKASTVPRSEQRTTQATKTVNETRSGGDVHNQKLEFSEDLTNCHLIGYQMSECLSSRDQSNTVDTGSVLSKTSKSGYVENETVGTSLSIPSKRKNGMVCSKRKCLKVNNVDLLELMVTSEDAQGLFRAPVDHAIGVVIIEDFVFEEYEDAPVIGRPTIIAKGSVGEDFQWAQCDNCLKWRKLPPDFLLPARWTCSENSWDPNRSSCDAAQELSVGQLKDLLSINSPAASGKMRELGTHSSGALEALAISTIQEDSEASPDLTPLTSKHPHHRPHCFCLVCNKQSSGKGPKHQQNCTCNICTMVKQESRTIMLHHERSQSGKEATTREHNLQANAQSPRKLNPRIELLDNGNSGYVKAKEKVIFTSMKGQFDLNIQPEWEEEASTCFELTRMAR